jgi:hypothetical protein
MRLVKIELYETEEEHRVRFTLSNGGLTRLILVIDEVPDTYLRGLLDGIECNVKGQMVHEARPKGP